MADNSQEIETSNDFSKLKVVDLKKILKNKGLSTVGNKQELVERLQQSDAAIEDLLEGSGTGEEGFDEELEDIDEAALMKDDKEDAIEEGKDGEAEDKIEEGAKVNDETSAENIEPPNKKKKLSINRAVPESVAADQSSPGEGGQSNGEVKKGAADSSSQEGEGGGGGAKEEGELLGEDAKPGEEAQPKRVIIKTKAIETLLDDKHKKLSLRAQKFGLTEAAKKELRAARFGISTKSTASDPDILKKRAERFGMSPSTKDKTELEKKLQMRKERFQTGGGSSQPQKSAASASSLEEKKALRAQRFKITAPSS